MRSLTRREKILIFLGLLMVVAGVYYYLFYLPIQEDQDQVRQQVESLQQEYEIALEQIQEIPELEEKLEDLREEREEILEAGIREPEEILAVINRFSTSTGITINSYAKGDVEDGHSFQLDIEGSYIPLLEFISLLDNWDYRLEIEDFSLAAEEGEIDVNFSFLFHQWEELDRYLAEIEAMEE